jgi:hypothetical protein
LALSDELFQQIFLFLDFCASKLNFVFDSLGLADLLHCFLAKSIDLLLNRSQSFVLILHQVDIGQANDPPQIGCVRTKTVDGCPAIGLDGLKRSRFFNGRPELCLKRIDRCAIGIGGRKKFVDLPRVVDDAGIHALGDSEKSDVLLPNPVEESVHLIEKRKVATSSRIVLPLQIHREGEQMDFGVKITVALKRSRLLVAKIHQNGVQYRKRTPSWEVKKTVMRRKPVKQCGKMICSDATFPYILRDRVSSTDGFEIRSS